MAGGGGRPTSVLLLFDVDHFSVDVTLAIGGCIVLENPIKITLGGFMGDDFDL